MARRPRRDSDPLVNALVARTIELLGKNGWRPAELARRIGMSEANLSRYLRPDSRPAHETGYHSWPSWLVVRIAFAFALPLQEFFGSLWDKEPTAVTATLQNPASVWDPTGQSAQEVLQLFGRHEEIATDGIGLFRVPPCPIQVQGMFWNIHRNLFADLGAIGNHVIEAYREIDKAYSEEYRKCGGHYENFTLTALVFEEDVLRLINGEGEYFGCHNLAARWLDELWEIHIKRMNYKIGFMCESRIPERIRYDLLDADSLITVGTTLSMRRCRYTFRLTPHTAGERLLRDQQYLRTLRDGYADLSMSGMRKKVEYFKREADRKRKSSPR